MRRREFIALLSSAAASGPLAARAQLAEKIRTIGFLGANTRSAQEQSSAALVERLGELGWTEGRNILIEYRWAEGRFDRSPDILAEFVRLNVAVIVTHASLNAIAAKRATSVVPVVFAAVGDPVGLGLVASLARPGGNLTGLSLQSSDLTGKRLEILREVIPSLQRLAILANADNPIVLDLNDVQAAARTLNLEVTTPEIRCVEEIAPAIQALAGRTDALYVQTDPLFNTHRISIDRLAQAARLPTMYAFRDYVDSGGLMSYGPNYTDLFRRAADFVDKILRGAMPGDLPVEQPTKFELVINLKTAKILGLDVPPALLARADEVIE